MVEIREAIPEDAQAISLLNEFQMGYKYSITETREKIVQLSSGKTDKIFVAVMDGNVVGYVHANDYDTLYIPRMKNILGIAVDEDYKHQGIGHMLMNAVEAWAKESNAKGIRLVSGITRTTAHKFYENCGFSEGKQQINYKKFFE